MVSPDSPFFKVSSGVDRTSKSSEPAKYGPLKETQKTKTDFRELLGAEERDPETAEEIGQQKGSKVKNTPKRGSSTASSSKASERDAEIPSLSIFDLPSQKKTSKELKITKDGSEESETAQLLPQEDGEVFKQPLNDDEQPREHDYDLIAASDEPAPSSPAPALVQKEAPAMSPSDLFKTHPKAAPHHQMLEPSKDVVESAGQTIPTEKPISKTKTTDRADIPVAKTKGPVKEDTQFIEERPDLSSINPMMIQAPQQQTQMGIPVVKQDVAQPAVRKDLEKLVTQIIDQIYTMKMEDRQETMVTLKHPPLFEGARLTLISFEKTAQGQFNITFDNLTQAAKNVLDMNGVQDSLRLALEKQGYNVHIVTTTTTTIDNPIAATLQQMQQERERGDQRQQQQGQQQQEQEQQEQEEQ